MSAAVPAQPSSVSGDVSFTDGVRIYARMTLMRLRRGRVLWAALALMVSPILYVVPLAIGGHWGRGLFDDINDLYFKFLIPFVPALLAAPTMAEELENKTFTFVFARPAPRSSLVAGKYLAAITPLVLVTLPTVLLVWLIALARFPADMIDGWPHLLRVEAAVMFGLFAYGALALAIGTVFSRFPFVAVVLYLGLIEFWLESTPVSLNMIAISWHLRNLAQLPLPSTEFASFTMPAWGSAIIAAGATPLLLKLAAFGVTGAEYRTDR